MKSLESRVQSREVKFRRAGSGMKELREARDWTVVRCFGQELGRYTEALKH